jgi:hypothetical protein
LYIQFSSTINRRSLDCRAVERRIGSGILVAEEKTE